MKVIVDPTVLATALRQVLDNIDKHGDPQKSILIVVEIVTSAGAKTSFGQRSTPEGKVSVIMTNDGTSRPKSNKITVRGLADVRVALDEYGAELDYGAPEDLSMSFGVIMTFDSWREEEK